MRLKRSQRRVQGKKVNYWIDTDTGVEYSTKPARKQHSRRSDVKCVSHNNIVPVTFKLLLERGTELLDSVQGNTAAEQLVLDTWDGICDNLFLLFNCAASYDVWAGSERHVRSVCFRFLSEFYPDALQDEMNKDVQPLRYQRGGYTGDKLDDDEWVKDWVEQHSDGTVLGELVPRDVSTLRRRTDTEYIPTPDTIKGVVLKSSRADTVKYSMIADCI